MRYYLLLSFLLVGCGSAPNPGGIVYDRTGQPSIGTVVRLISVDETGLEISEFAQTVTDSTGRFTFDLNQDTNASVLVEADLSSGKLRGFWASSLGAVAIHPLTHAWSNLTFDITGSQGQREPEDFSAQELRDISRAIFSAQDQPSALDDGEVLENYLRETIGRKIAEAAGGTIDLTSSSQFQSSEAVTMATFSQQSAICTALASVNVLSSDVFRFDVEEDGSLCGGNHASLDPSLVEGAMLLSLSDVKFYGSGYFFPSDAGPFALLEGGREIVLGPLSLAVPGSSPQVEDMISMTRKIYVPEGGGYARYLEIIENELNEDRTITLNVNSVLRGGNQTEVLSNDNYPLAPSINDRFYVYEDPTQNRPTVAFITQGEFASEAVDALESPGVSSGSPGEVTYTWQDVLVPAQSTVTLMHFILFSTSRSALEMHSLLSAFVENPDTTGMTLDELKGLKNYTPNRGTIFGDAGSVVGKAVITAVNERTGETIIVNAMRDGSFAVPLSLDMGDTATLSASDGLMTSLVTP